MKVDGSLNFLPKMTQVPGQNAATADQLEQAFLEQMLKYCGPQPGKGAFSGGAGEQQFASFLTQEHAAILAQSLDLGLGKYLKE